MSRIAVLLVIFALHAPMSFADTGDTGDWADTGETPVDGIGAASMAGDPGGAPSCAVAPSGGIAAVALALGLAIGRRG